MTSEGLRCALPLRIASAGLPAVENFLKISMPPDPITTKSVNVPPESTPTRWVRLLGFRISVYELDSGSILNLLCCDEAKSSGCYAGEIPSMDCRLPGPLQFLFGRRHVAKLFDPAEHAFTTRACPGDNQP